MERTPQLSDQSERQGQQQNGSIDTYASTTTSRRTSLQSTIGELPEFPQSECWGSLRSGGVCTPLSVCDADSTASTPNGKPRPTPTSPDPTPDPGSAPNSSRGEREPESALSSAKLTEFLLRELEHRPTQDDAVQ